MNKEQREARERNEKVLARNFPNADARKLQNELYALAVKCENNATQLCNTPNWPDQREQLRQRLAQICAKHHIQLAAEVTGDPRGFCLKLHLPDGSWNSLGGKEAGYGIGSV